ncbi:hypothetical protein [Xanthobacter autotrophicus]|uniref:hypothetical protein n=1 Tax=Xanthobacter autotrophicus TaxID=280 RepID=UPI003727C992
MGYRLAMLLRPHDTPFDRSRAQVPDTTRGRGMGRKATGLFAVAAMAIALGGASTGAGAQDGACAQSARSGGKETGSKEASGPGGATGPALGLAAIWSDTGTLLLSDGRRFMPEGIALPSRLASDAALPRAAESAAWAVLDTCLVGFGSAHVDRHGRLSGPGWLACPARNAPAEEDLATALLRAGAGYAQPNGQDRQCLTQRLAAETQARTARRGIWAEPSAVAPAGDEEAMAIRAGLFTVAEGRVLAAGGTRDRIFLNFGSSWRQDFTAMMEREDFATIMGDSLEPAMLRGTLVQVRGVVRAEGGPAIMLRRPGEIALQAGAQARAARGKRGGE